MPSCGSRNCDHCFPRNGEKIDVLEDILSEIDSYPGNFDPENTFFHDDFYWEHKDEPWFQAMVAAYKAGVASVRTIVADLLAAYR